MMEMNSPLSKCLITVGLAFLTVIIYTHLLAWRYKIKPKPLPLLSVLPALLVLLIVFFAPLAAITFWGDYISVPIKAAIIIWLVGVFVGWKIHMWRKYHVLWGLPKEDHDKENS
jgi:hypothetical protein